MKVIRLWDAYADNTKIISQRLFTLACIITLLAGLDKIELSLFGAFNLVGFFICDLGQYISGALVSYNRAKSAENLGMAEITIYENDWVIKKYLFCFKCVFIFLAIVSLLF